MAAGWLRFGSFCLAILTAPLVQAQQAATAPVATPAVAPAPPRARTEAKRLEKHGDVRVDNYYWLKERENPEVIAYLQAENAYTDAMMAPRHELQEKLFQEIVGRIKQDDDTVPYQDGDYWYQQRYVPGGEYAIYSRHQGGPTGPAQTLIDGNQLAAGHGYFSVTGVHVSSGQAILVYATDVVGRRFYTIHFRDLRTNQDLPDSIPNVTGNSAWANDDRTLFYVKQDPETLRWDKVYRHVLGADPAQDALVYEERDPEFSCSVEKTKSKRYVLLDCEQTESTEVRFLDADHPEGEFRVFQAREPKHEYSIDHHGDEFVIRTNLNAKNFRLMRAPVTATTKENWTEVVPHREDVYLEGSEVYRDWLVLLERQNGLLRLRVRKWDGSGDHYVDFGEPAYLAFPGDNAQYDSGVLRYVYTSLTTPQSVYDYDMATHAKKLRKEAPVLGGFDKSRYVTERLTAPARDGTRVPISLVYRKGLHKNGTHPLLLYGYGSYGYSTDASFRSERLSLLDRGFVYAIAHVRGGQELGRDWYENGRLMHKKNTFTDFIDCAKYLVAQRYTSADRLFAQGGSAGGLLMGAVANMAPELFAGIVAQVPYVDVVTTMLDPDIPLTTGEYREWGDPNDKAAYEYMLSYSPYDHVEAKAYPSMLVTTGLHDSQVQYWEPAKWVAKLRALKTDDHQLLLKTNMEAGHSGVSGRFRKHHETALIYAFLLDLAGKTGSVATR